jgi:hypothetical protein
MVSRWRKEIEETTDREHQRVPVSILLGQEKEDDSIFHENSSHLIAPGLVYYNGIGARLIIFIKSFILQVASSMVEADLCMHLSISDSDLLRGGNLTM